MVSHDSHMRNVSTFLPLKRFITESKNHNEPTMEKPRDSYRQTKGQHTTVVQLGQVKALNTHITH